MTDWNVFPFEPRFRAESLRDDLIQIEAHRLSLNQLHLPKDWKEDLQKLYIVRAVHGTTAIEGNPLSEAEVARQLTEPSGKGKPDQLHQQTANAAKAFQWVERHFAQWRPLRLEDILTLHQLLTEGSDEHENVPGRLRDHNVVVGSPDLGGVHQAPPAARPRGDSFSVFWSS